VKNKKNVGKFYVNLGVRGKVASSWDVHKEADNFTKKGRNLTYRTYML